MPPTSPHTAPNESHQQFWAELKKHARTPEELVPWGVKMRILSIDAIRALVAPPLEDFMLAIEWLEALKPDSNLREHRTYISIMSELIDAAFYQGMVQRAAEKMYAQGVRALAKKLEYFPFAPPGVLSKEELRTQWNAVVQGRCGLDTIFDRVPPGTTSMLTLEQVSHERFARAVRADRLVPVAPSDRVAELEAQLDESRAAQAAALARAEAAEAAAVKASEAAEAAALMASDQVAGGSKRKAPESVELGVSSELGDPTVRKTPRAMLPPHVDMPPSPAQPVLLAHRASMAADSPLSANRPVRTVAEASVMQGRLAREEAVSMQLTSSQSASPVKSASTPAAAAPRPPAPPPPAPPPPAPPPPAAPPPAPPPPATPPLAAPPLAAPAVPSQPVLPSKPLALVTPLLHEGGVARRGTGGVSEGVRVCQLHTVVMDRKLPGGCMCTCAGRGGGCMCTMRRLWGKVR